MRENYRKIFAALAMTLVLASSGFADDGIIHTEIAPPPPPPAIDGIIHTGSTDALTEVALSLLQGLLTRF